MPGLNEVPLIRCATGEQFTAAIVELNRDIAQQRIDAVWWNELDPESLVQPPDEESDRDWDWRELVSQILNKPRGSAWAVQSDDGTVHAAMRLFVGENSAFDATKKTVYIDRLATSPINRKWLVSKPFCRGAGTALVVFAVAFSMDLGLEGRVNLAAADAEPFYEGIGFAPTAEFREGATIWELSSDCARELLAGMGVTDGSFRFY